MTQLECSPFNHLIKFFKILKMLYSRNEEAIILVNKNIICAMFTLRHRCTSCFEIHKPAQLTKCQYVTKKIEIILLYPLRILSRRMFGLSAVFKYFMPNSVVYMELWTEHFSYTPGIDCSNSVNHDWVQVLSYWKYSLLFTFCWDWTCNLQMISLRINDFLWKCIESNLL